MFYYTPTFASITTDIDGFIDQVLAETNQGYINSGVAIEAVRLCAEEATIDDSTDALITLAAFRAMKGNDPAAANLRNSADAAVLLVGSFDSCGVAYFHTLGSGFTLSVVKKSCALGYYSFGHEVGHSMGLAHNPEETTNTLFPQGHGHLIQPGPGSRGYRTILAYSAQGHRDRKNYYSNPAVLLPNTGTPTGKVGVSNNAAVLNMNRFRMAGVGDESSACFDGLLISRPPLLASPVPVPVPTTIASTTNNITTTSITTATTTTNNMSTTTTSTNPSGEIYLLRIATKDLTELIKSNKNLFENAVFLQAAYSHRECLYCRH